MCEHVVCGFAMRSKKCKPTVCEVGEKVFWQDYVTGVKCCKCGLELKAGEMKINNIYSGEPHFEDSERMERGKTCTEQKKEQPKSSGLWFPGDCLD